MEQNMVELIDKHLGQLEAVVREAAPAVWGITLRQVIVSNAILLMTLGVVAIALAVAWKFTLRLTKQKDSFGGWTEGAIAAVVITSVVSGIWTLVTLTCGTFAVIALLNPEYAAMMKIVAMFK